MISKRDVFSFMSMNNSHLVDLLRLEQLAITHESIIDEIMVLNASKGTR